MNQRKGIILAGGMGTRLFPATSVICKQLLPIYDKPMIFYPLSTLMLAGIQEILIISTPESTPIFEQLLGDGSQLGLKIQYKVQHTPNGLAQAFVLGESFIGDSPVALVLGDNVFYGNSFSNLLQEANQDQDATIFGYYIKNPIEYGVVSFNTQGEVETLEEKPTHPKSDYAVVGLYFYSNDVIQIAKELKPSARGEYEITDLNRVYLEKKRLKVKLLGRGYAWLDTGNCDALAEATAYVKAIEDRQGLKIACIEEIAWRMGFIDKDQLKKLGNKYSKSTYGHYILALCE